MMNTMDSSGSGTVKKTTWKSSKKTMPDAKDETEDSRKRREGGEKRRCLAQSFVLPLLPIAEVEESSSNGLVSFTGSACRGKSGPRVGSVDIGVSKSAYYFCIALPGVKRDPGEFSCSVKKDGKVCVRGVTSTGGKVVKKYSKVFEMKIQQLCPPGPFTLFFSLPGPVDPKLLSSTLRTDGIFEAVVAKCE